MAMPMSYASVADVFATVPLISSASSVTSSVVAHHGGRAQALIDAKLSMYYSVPFAGSPPPIINAVAVDLTAYYVLAGDAILANNLKDSPWPAVYKQAIKTLDDLSLGHILLLSGSGTVIDQLSAQSGVFTSIGDYNPTFDERDFEELSVDPNKLDDLRNRT